MKQIPADWQSAYESFARFIVGRAGFCTYFFGLILLCLAHSATRGASFHGISFREVVIVWFLGFLILFVASSPLGWDEIAERKRLEGKLKPIPVGGKKIELYDINSGKALAHISEVELQFLIDSFQEWGMSDNDFYIMRETVDLFEERQADPHLVATLRQMMGKKNDMEIGWTRVSRSTPSPVNS